MLVHVVFTPESSWPRKEKYRKALGYS